MEAKVEAPNSTPAPKPEIPHNSQTGPKSNGPKFQQGPGGPNMGKKKNFQNRGEKMGNNNNQGPRNNNRGPMKNEVRKIKFDIACSAAIFLMNRK